jgi:3-oxoadipate enol-lactonase
MSFVALNGITLHYRDSGPPERPAIVFVNSLGTDLRIWDEVVALLAPRYRCIGFDKRGHGLSDSPPGPYSLDQHIGDILGLAAHRGIRRFDLAGVSIGGLIAQGVAARHPDRVRALVLCDTAARLGSAESWSQRIEKIEAGGMAAIVESIMELWFSPTFRRDRPADLAGWRNMFLRADPAGYIANCGTLRDTDLTPEVGAITAPTLVLAGGEDASTPPALVEQTARLIPDARFEIVAGAGHIPSIEQPALLSALIEAFLKETTHG